MNDCRNEELVEEIFGSVSEFARQVEMNGDNFTYGSWTVTHDEQTDIHTFLN
jgi:hypothetical protein